MHLLDRASGLSVLFEWLGLLLVAGSLASCPFPKGIRLHILIVAALLVFVGLSIAQSSVVVLYPEYWGGFGTSVLILALALSVVFLLTIAVARAKTARFATQAAGRYGQSLLSFLALALTAWSMPSLIQPMDGWLNLGDSTEKVLDEVAGWANGNVPGVQFGWHHNSLLGLPLAPLSLFEGRGDEKIVLVVLYVNFLVLMLPTVMASVIVRVVPSINRVQAFALSLVCCSISGSPVNTAVVQELGFMSRLLLPLTLGALVVRFRTVLLGPRHLGAALLAIASTITFWNNLEFGGGAAAASFAVICLSEWRNRQFVRRMITFVAWSAFTSVVVLLPGKVYGGEWFARRLGGIGDVFFGEMSISTFNNLGPIPPFSLTALWFALSLVATAVGVRGLIRHSSQRSNQVEFVPALYFGVWSLFSFPYILHNGGDGAFRTQFLFVPVALLSATLWGGIRADFARWESRLRERQSLRISEVAKGVVFLPLVLVASLVVASTIQTPNGVREWQRIQTPEQLERNLDEWSPAKLDWIRPASVLELAEGFGGSEKVGWWYAYGNAIEILTGVENLLGLSGFENVRSPNQYRLACEPLLKSELSFVISIARGESLLRGCGLPYVRAQTRPNEDGLIVYQIARPSN